MLTLPPSMMLSCNAVGDLLALIKLAIDIAKFLNDCRGAPAECCALCNELRALERMLTISKPTILALQDACLREIVAERMQMVSAHIEEALQLVTQFGSAFDVPVTTSPIQNRCTTLLRWATKAFQSVEWELRRYADVKACRVAISQSLEPLTFALLVHVCLSFFLLILLIRVRSAFQADQKAVLGVLQESFTGLAKEVRAGYERICDVAAGQAALYGDTLSLKEAFDKHLMALQFVREQVSSAHAQFADTLAATRLDITDVRRRLDAFCQTTVTSADLSSSTQTIVDVVTRESTSTRANLEPFFIATSNDRLTNRIHLTSIESKLDQVIRLLGQPVPPVPSDDLALHHRLPGVQQLQVIAARIQEFSPMFLPAILSALVSNEIISAAMLFSMIASGSADKVAYAIAAFLLIVANNISQLYKTPPVVHVVFVEDFFGYALEIPASKCSNRQVRSGSSGTDSAQPWYSNSTPHSLKLSKVAWDLFLFDVRNISSNLLVLQLRLGRPSRGPGSTYLSRVLMCT